MCWLEQFLEQMQLMLSSSPPTPDLLPNGELLGKRQRVAIDATNRWPFSLKLNGLDDNVDKVRDSGVSGPAIAGAGADTAGQGVVVEQGNRGGPDVLGRLMRASEVVEEPARLEEGVLDDLQSVRKLLGGSRGKLTFLSLFFSAR